MTKEEKELLLVDLSARIPYGVILRQYNSGNNGYINNCGETVDIQLSDMIHSIFESGFLAIRPYLRSLSDMTEEEKNYLSIKYIWRINCGQIKIRYHSEGYWDEDTECSTDEYIRLFDWLNAHHFDYRDLIDKGLAIKAPEGMYN